MIANIFCDLIIFGIANIDLPTIWTIFYGSSPLKAKVALAAHVIGHLICCTSLIHVFVNEKC